MYQQPKKRLSRRTWLIIIAAIVALVAISGISSALQGKSDAGASTTPVATHAPVAKAVHPRLGGSVSDFTSAYGQSTSQGVGGYTWQSGNITVTTQPKDGATYGTHALTILLNAPGQGWNEHDALAACMAYAPTDATYTGPGTMGSSNAGTGIERLYDSTSLVHQLPASEFLDSNLNPTKPGTFAIILNYESGSTTTFVSCAIQTQLE